MEENAEKYKTNTRIIGTHNSYWIIILSDKYCYFLPLT